MEVHRSMRKGAQPRWRSSLSVRSSLWLMEAPWLAQPPRLWLCGPNFSMSRLHDAERGIQLIDGSIGFYSQAVLPDLLPSRESCLSGISRASVDFRDAHLQPPLANAPRMAAHGDMIFRTGHDEPRHFLPILQLAYRALNV